MPIEQIKIKLIIDDLFNKKNYAKYKKLILFFVDNIKSYLDQDI